MTIRRTHERMLRQRLAQEQRASLVPGRNCERATRPLPSLPELHLAQPDVAGTTGKPIVEIHSPQYRLGLLHFRRLDIRVCEAARGTLVRQLATVAAPERAREGAVREQNGAINSRCGATIP